MISLYIGSDKLILDTLYQNLKEVQEYNISGHSSADDEVVDGSCDVDFSFESLFDINKCLVQKNDPVLQR